MLYLGKFKEGIAPGIRIVLVSSNILIKELVIVVVVVVE